MAKRKITYNSLHWWIRRHHGSASKCENKECREESKVFEWSLKKGKKYNKDISNYWQLCRKCHFKYDLREYQKKKFDEGRLKAQKKRLGAIHSEETREKIKLAIKKRFPNGRTAWNKGKNKIDYPQLSNSGVKKGNIPWNKRISNE